MGRFCPAVMVMVLHLQSFSSVTSFPTVDNIHELSLPEALSALPPRELQRQFIGTSVIGGLMWPVLLTLAMTAMAARVPDFFRNIFSRITGGSGGGQLFRDDDLELNGLENSPEFEMWLRRLDDTLKIFERLVDTQEGGNS